MEVDTTPVSEQLHSPTKSFKMKLVVLAIEEYNKTKREEFARTINIHLQSLSVTIDLSVFDPQTNHASQFYISLYELMNTMDPGVSFAWKCVDVLSNACRNRAARKMLIHTYQFIPCLCRLLDAQMPNEKKINLLRLMQNLSCGIIISWQIPHLNHLMSTLTGWILGNSSNEIVALSLGVIANLCYKNVPAAYSLMKCANVKKMLRSCGKREDLKIQLHTFRLFMILDSDVADSEEQLSKIAQITFKLIIEALEKRDSLLIRQIVEFFVDINNKKQLNGILNNEDYSEQLEKIIQIIEINAMDTGEVSSPDPESIALALKFLNFLSQLNYNGMKRLYSSIIQLALKWIDTDIVSTEALLMLKTIATRVDKSQQKILTPLVLGLPIFFAGINFAPTKDTPIEEITKIVSLLQLLTVMAQEKTIQKKIIDELKPENCQILFRDLVDNTSGVAEFTTFELIKLYTCAIALVNELGKNSPNWRVFMNELLAKKQVYLMMAQCFQEGDKESKKIVLNIVFNHGFNQEEFIDALQLINPDFVQGKKSHWGGPGVIHQEPVLSVAQVHALDGILSKFKETLENRPDSGFTSDLMELYEYKIASFANSERHAMADVAAASERCTHFQHRVSKLTAELGRSHQLLYRCKQHNEHLLKAKTDLEDELKTLRTHSEENRVKSVQMREEWGALKKRLKEVEVERLVEREEAEGEIARLRAAGKRFEESATKLEKVLGEKREALEKAQATIESLNKVVGQTQGELEDREGKLEVVTKELTLKREMIDMITKYCTKGGSSFGLGDSFM